MDSHIVLSKWYAPLSKTKTLTSGTNGTIIYTTIWKDSMNEENEKLIAEICTDIDLAIFRLRKAQEIMNRLVILGQIAFADVDTQDHE